jgi:hypothetical protein
MDKLLTNKLSFIISMIMGITIWFLFKDAFLNLDDMVNKLRCESQKEAMKENIKRGVILSKYLDKDQRNLRTIKYVNGNDTLVSEIFFYEGSDFYEYLHVGDSIRKESGSLKFFVKRDGRDSSYVLYYGCEK